MIYTPDTGRQLLQRSETRSQQRVGRNAVARHGQGAREHLFKFGFDFQHSGYEGMSTSRLRKSVA
jgi:hypothetical protein